MSAKESNQTIDAMIPLTPHVVEVSRADLASKGSAERHKAAASSTCSKFRPPCSSANSNCKKVGKLLRPIPHRNPKNPATALLFLQDFRERRSRSSHLPTGPAPPVDLFR
jgi:hypothetical protein